MFKMFGSSLSSFVKAEGSRSYEPSTGAVAAAPGVAEDRPSIRCRVSWQSMGNHAGGLSCDWSLK